MADLPPETGEPLRRVSEDLCAYLEGLDPDRITPAVAAALFPLFAKLRRLASAGELLLAPKAAEAGEWRNEGHRSPAAWMAAISGTGLGEAISNLETGERLETLDATRDALRRGALSMQKAKDVAAVAVAIPVLEGELLAVAEFGSMRRLKDYCRRVTQQWDMPADENAHYAAVHASRYFRHWTDRDGAFKGEFKLTADQGARLLCSIDARADVLFDEARKNDVREAPAAYAADALVDLVTRRASPTHGGSRTNAVVHVRVDGAALRRGHVAWGEMCEIAGIGPVPVSTVRSLLPEAFVKVLITDGVDIATVCHVGRSIPAHLRSAIEERDPTCVVPGCDVATGLEIDHWETDFALGGPASMANLARLCHFHHGMKTYQGFELRGGPGKWEWEPPPPFDSS